MIYMKPTSPQNDCTFFFVRVVLFVGQNDAISFMRDKFHRLYIWRLLRLLVLIYLGIKNLH